MTQIANIVRVGERFIVADKDSYNLLRLSFFPATVIPEAMMDTARTLLAYKGVEFKEQDFESDVLLPFIKRARASWGSKHEAFTSQHQSGMLILDSASSGAETARAIAPKIESIMASFFRRWGFKHAFEISESRGKVRIGIEYSVDPKSKPVIELEKNVKELPKFELELGGFKISLALDDPKGRIESNGNSKDVHIGYVHVDLSIKQGGRYVPYHSGRCTYGEVSSVAPMMVALMQIAENHPENINKKAAATDD